MKIKRVIIFIFIFIISFCFNYFLTTINVDEFWNYGFAYNISKGLVPYRDFNIIVTPLYNFIISLFIIFFGHHLYSMYFFNMLIITVLIVGIYKKIKFDVFVIVPFLFLINYCGYNLLSVFLVFLLLYLYDNNFKNKDFVLGIVVGLMILSKQTVGVCVFIPLFFLSKNKIKYFIGVFIPLLIFGIYLLYNNALYQFVDYCFLGLFSFSSKNKIFLIFPIEISFIILLLYLYKIKKLDNSVFIVLAFQIITAPIFDFFHCFCGFVVIIFYLLLKFKFNILLKVLFFSLGVIVLSFLVKKPLLVDDDNSFLYGKNLPINYDVIKIIDNYYIDGIKNYDYVFLFSDLAYAAKLDLGYTTNKYDLINDGNMGYGGYKSYIKEIDNMCTNKKCFFVIDTQYIKVITKHVKIEYGDTNQTNLNIIKYVYKNYNMVDSEYGFSLYSN